jgi:hypothetical protein
MQTWTGNQRGDYPGSWFDDKLTDKAASAARHILKHGYASDGRPSLAALWLRTDMQLTRELDPEQQRSLARFHPWTIAYVGALPEPVEVIDDETASRSDSWAVALDAAGANDRVVAFFDHTARLEREGSLGEGGYDSRVLICLFASDPLLLEPLPSRLFPGRLDLDLDPDAYGEHGTRRVPTTAGPRIVLTGEGREMVGDALGRLREMAEAAGVSPDATIGETVEALYGAGALERHHDEMEELYESHLGAARAFAIRAMGGLILTEMNEHATAPHDRDRWLRLAGDHEHAFGLLAGLVAEAAPDPVTELEDKALEFFDVQVRIAELMASTVLREPSPNAFDQLLRNYHETTGLPGDGLLETACAVMFSLCDAAVVADPGASRRALELFDAARVPFGLSPAARGILADPDARRRAAEADGWVDADLDGDLRDRFALYAILGELSDQA